MDSSCPRCPYLTIRGYGLKARRSRFCSLFLVLLVGFVSINAIAGIDVQTAPVSSVGLGPQFAIVDFDGDHVPDLASIQTGLGSSATGSYWIQLKLTSVEQSTIRLVAPAGGLLIEALDVNGDHLCDLVVATTSFRRPVAIFLNGGNSSFSRVDPAAFPGAMSESTANWGPAFDQERNPKSIPWQSETTNFPEASSLVYRKLPTGTVSIQGVGFLLNSFLVSHVGRAPPSEVPRF